MMIRALEKEVLSISIYDLIEYIVCPARLLIGRNVGKKPAKLIVRERARLGLNDLTIKALDQSVLNDVDISSIVAMVFKDLDYNLIEKDAADLTETYKSLSNMLGNYELTITGSVIPFELSYSGVIVRSDVDMIVRDEKTGYIHPVVVDFSHTKYDPMYNPIAYKCHTVAREMDIRGSNTEVLVLTAWSGKRWIYEHKKYHAILEASISESAMAVEQDMWPVRFGWWCAGCQYRGLCFKLYPERYL